MVGISPSQQPEGVNIPVTTDTPVTSPTPERAVSADIRPPAEARPPETPQTFQVPVREDAPEDMAMQTALGEIDQAAASSGPVADPAPPADATNVPVQVVGEETRDAVDASLGTGAHDDLEALVSQGPDDGAPEEPTAVELPKPPAPPAPVETAIPVEQPAPLATDEPAKRDMSAPIPFAGAKIVPPLDFPSKTQVAQPAGDVEPPNSSQMYNPDMPGVIHRSPAVAFGPDQAPVVDSNGIETPKDVEMDPTSFVDEFLLINPEDEIKAMGNTADPATIDRAFNLQRIQAAVKMFRGAQTDMQLMNLIKELQGPETNQGAK